MRDNVAHGVSVTNPRRAACLMALVLGVALLAAGCRYSVDLEPLSAAPQSSTIVAANGKALATLDTGEHRVDVPLRQMAPVLRDAVIAIEDHRYWDHPGVDVRAVLRAVSRDASEGEIAEGGS